MTTAFRVKHVFALEQAQMYPATTSALKLMAFLSALLIALAAPAWAADPVKQHNSSALWFENWIGLSNATLIVLAPDGTVTQIEAASGTPVFELNRGAVVDGIYSYELVAATEETEAITNQIDNGRGDAQRDSRAVPFHTSGRFTVSRGIIITPEEIKEEDG